MKRISYRRWTPVEKRAVLARYPHEPTRAIAADLGRSIREVFDKAGHLGLRKSAAFFVAGQGGRILKGGRLSVATQFKHGLTPWNKGTHYVAGGRSALTRFHKGQVARNAQEAGALRLNADGYLDIKVAPGTRQWVQLHRYNWQQAHGRKPPRGKVLAFRDGDRMNCELDNLELLSRRQLIARNSIHTLPAPLAEVIRTRAVLTRAINRTLNQRSSTCQTT